MLELKRSGASCFRSQVKTLLKVHVQKHDISIQCKKLDGVTAVQTAAPTRFVYCQTEKGVWWHINSDHTTTSTDSLHDSGQKKSTCKRQLVTGNLAARHSKVVLTALVIDLRRSSIVKGKF